MKGTGILTRIRSSDSALENRTQQIDRLQKTKGREKYMAGVYEKKEKHDVPSKREREWRKLERLGCLESFGATQPCKREGLVIGTVDLGTYIDGRSA